MLLCLLCHKSSSIEDEHKISRTSAKWLNSNVDYMLKKHLWQIDLRADSWLCSACWLSLNEFHEFYMEIYKIHMRDFGIVKKEFLDEPYETQAQQTNGDERTTIEQKNNNSDSISYRPVPSTYTNVQPANNLQSNTNGLNINTCLPTNKFRRPYKLILKKYLNFLRRKQYADKNSLTSLVELKNGNKANVSANSNTNLEAVNDNAKPAQCSVISIKSATQINSEIALQAIDLQLGDNKVIIL